MVSAIMTINSERKNNIVKDAENTFRIFSSFFSPNEYVKNLCIEVVNAPFNNVNIAIKDATILYIP